MLYDKVSTQLNFVERERAMMEFWRESHVEQLCRQEHAEGPHFTIYDLSLIHISTTRIGPSFLNSSLLNSDYYSIAPPQPQEERYMGGYTGLD